MDTRITTTQVNTILVTDDDPLVRQSIGNLLRKDGYAVIEAATSAEALSACANGANPDFVLVDAVMAGMDGFTLCQKIKALPNGTNIIVIMLSNLDDDAAIQRAFEYGADDYILKPVQPILLRQRVRQLQKFKSIQQQNDERNRVLEVLSDDYLYEIRVEADGTLITDRVSSNFLVTTGYAVDELSADGWLKLVHPDDLQRAQGRYERLLRNKADRLEFRIITRTGDVRWLDDNAYPIYDESENRVVRIYGIGRDVTETKLQEAKHRLNEERLQLALDAAEDGIWDWNMLTGEVYYSPRWVEMLGFTTDEVADDFSTWEDLLHPEDADRVQAALMAHFNRNVPYDVEHRLRTKRGDWKWIRATGKVVRRDDNNTPLRMTGTHQDIDERKKIQESLLENESRLSALINNASDIIYTLSFDGVFLYASPNWTENLGHDPEEIIGTNFREIVHPDDIVICEEFLTRVIETGQKHRGVEYRVQHKDGTWYWHTSAGSLAQDENGKPLYYVGAAHDITEQKMVKNALAENERRYRIISDTISDYAYSYIVNPDNTLTKDWSTQAFYDITGYTWQEMDSDGWSRITHPDDLPAAYQRFENLLAGKVDVIEFRIYTKSGEIRWLRDHGHPYYDEEAGRVTHIYGAAQDITQRKEFEDQMRQQAIELQTRNEELDAFAYTVAHDLKNPISSMMGFTSLILNYLDRMDDDKIRENLQLIMEGGYKLKEIINALLLLAGVNKMEGAQMTEIDMREVVSAAKKRMMSTIVESGATIILPDEWLPAIGYAPWIEEIWANYLSNAIKYGGEPPHIKLGSEKVDGDMVRYWVKDNGQGLTEDEQGHVFTPFTRLSQVKIEGHGLGLSVVHRIVEKLGGQVGVESEVGKGSVFSFTLPAVKRDQ
ncbi:MAG: PAS domain-containing protein [Aggregatilineales bacterium]